MEQKHEETKVISCGLCVVRNAENNPQILLVNSGFNKYWGIPKGHIEVGETNEECAIREVLEETGIVATVGMQLPVCSTYLRGGNHKTLFSFIAFESPAEQIISGDGENEQIEFFELDKLPLVTRWQMPIVDAVKAILQKNEFVSPTY